MVSPLRSATADSAAGEATTITEGDIASAIQLRRSIGLAGRPPQCISVVVTVRLVLDSDPPQAEASALIHTTRVPAGDQIIKPLPCLSALGP